MHVVPRWSPVQWVFLKISSMDLEMENINCKTVLLLLTAILLVWLILCKVETLWLQYKHGAKSPCNVERDGFLGIRTGLKIIRHMQQGTLEEFQVTRYFGLRAPQVGTLATRVFGTRTLLTRDPENIKHILSTQIHNFSMGRRHRYLEPLLGDGIFVTDGPAWSHSRAMLRPQFTRQEIGHLSVLEPHVQQLAQHIKGHSGQAFELQELFFRLTVDTSTEILFGESARSLHHADGHQFATALTHVSDYLAKHSATYGMIGSHGDPEFVQSLTVVRGFADKYIARTLAMLERELREKLLQRFVFLYQLCLTTRDCKVLRDELLNILVAGRDTTAALLSFTVHELAVNPRIWCRLRQQVGDAFGPGASDCSRFLFESLKQCKYLQLVLKELLRVHPPVLVNTRTVRQTTTLPRGGGRDGQSPVLVRRGQSIILSVCAMHRDPAHYGSDAHVFEPMRWQDGRVLKIGWAYLPFSGGPRACLGQQFAVTEAAYVLARLAQMFPLLELVSPDGPYPPRVSVRMTSSLYDGLSIKMW